MKFKWTLRMAGLLIGLVFAVGLAREAGAAPGSGTLFGTAGGFLGTVNTSTGVGAAIGEIAFPLPFPSLAVDPTTGVMYASTGAGVPLFFSVNPATGAGTPVGDSGLGFASIAAMDFRANGGLFAAVNIAGNGGTGADHLAFIDKATGLAVVIGPFGVCTGIEIPSTGGGSCTIDGMEAIAFDSSGVLWGAKRGGALAAGTVGLYTINISTGAATFVAPILDSSSAPPPGGVVSLQYACDGTLYGGTGSSTSPPGGGRLITINPATGRFAFVGSVSATTGISLASLAFQSNCVVNNRVSFVPINSTISSSTNTAGCPAGFAGKFSFSARLTNTSVNALFALQAQVITLTGANLLQNADGGPGGVGAILTVPNVGLYSDGALNPAEFVDVPFIICLRQFAPFGFFVNALGVPGAIPVIVPPK